MSQFGWTFDQHATQYQSAVKGVSRWAFLTVAIAVIALWKVILPYCEHTITKVELEQQLTALVAEQESAAGQATQLAALEAPLKQGLEVAKERPWEAHTEALKQDLSSFGTFRGEVERAPDNDILKAIELNSPPQDEALIARESNLNVRQMEPIPEEDHLNRATRFKRNAIREGGRRPLRRSRGEIQGEVELARRSEAERERIERSTHELLPNRPNLPDAIRILAINEDDLAGREWQSNRPVFLNNRANQRAEELARTTIDSISADIQKTLIRPLEELMNKPGAKEHLPEVAQEIEQFSEYVKTWQKNYRDNPSWARTISSKDNTMERLQHELDEQRALLESRVAEAQNKAKTRHGELKEEIETLKTNISEQMDAKENLATELSSLLPSWLGDILNTNEIVRFYPMAIPVLVLLTGYWAYQVRLRYRFMAEIMSRADEPVDIRCMASIWTLARRRPIATATSLFIFIGGLGLVWWCYELAHHHRLMWMTAEIQAQTSEWNLGQARIMGWIGRGILITSLIGILSAFVRNPVRPAAPR